MGKRKKSKKERKTVKKWKRYHIKTNSIKKENCKIKQRIKK